jgi:hypothetical protein
VVKVAVAGAVLAYIVKSVLSLVAPERGTVIAVAAAAVVVVLPIGVALALRSRAARRSERWLFMAQVGLLVAGLQLVLVPPLTPHERDLCHDLLDAATAALEVTESQQQDVPAPGELYVTADQGRQLAIAGSVLAARTASKEDVRPRLRDGFREYAETAARIGLDLSDTGSGEASRRLGEATFELARRCHDA